MVRTSLQLGNITIHEPVTVISDCLISVLGLYIYFKLKKQSKNTAIGNWALFFGFMGLSTFLGAISHAFFEIREGMGYKSFWLAMQVVNGFSLFFAQRATAVSLLSERQIFRVWRSFFLIQLLVFIAAVLIIQKYWVTIVENGVVLIPVMLVHFLVKPKLAFQNKIGYGILFSFLTVFFYSSKWSIQPYYNYIDISHTIIFMSLYVMYLGVKKIETPLT